MKKVLIIAYYWPPSGGSGVQRWLKFVKYLPKFGWQPVVVVPENAEYPVIDSSLLEDIPSETEVIKIPIWEPYGIFKKITGRKKSEKVNTGLLFDEKKPSLTERISLWIRGNLLIPDPRVFWVRPASKKLKDLIPDISPDAIVTTGTPHSLHLIGLRLKKRFPDIRWLMDLRDPWSDLDMLDTFLASGWAKKRQRKLEKKALDAANIVTTVTPTWAAELQEKTSTPVKYITNGFDSEDFTLSKENTIGEQFIISHIGIINSYRNPVALWGALEEICSENPLFADKLNIQIIGITDKGLGNSLENFEAVKSRTIVTGYISHDKVVEKYQASSCLLLLLNNTKNSKGHIPGKFFEYLASRKPILAIGPEGSDVGQIIAENDAGYLCGFEDKTAIKAALKKIFSQFKANELENTSRHIDAFSRESLTKELVILLD